MATPMTSSSSNIGKGEEDKSRAMGHLKSIVNVDYKEILEENSENRRRAREATRLAKRYESESDALRKRIEELEAENSEHVGRITGLEDRLKELEEKPHYIGEGLIPETGSAWVLKDPRAKIDIDACSTDPFVVAGNDSFRKLLDSFPSLPDTLKQMLEQSQKEELKFDETENHPIEFFNEDRLKWKDKMETKRDELNKPLQKAIADGITNIKNIMAERNVEGNEFKELAADLEIQFSELEKICATFPLGDTYYVDLLTENLLKPVHEIIHAKYKDVFDKQQKEYVDMQKECEELVVDKEAMWKAGVKEENDEEALRLKMEAAEKEVKLYEKLIGEVLETNIKIRNLISSSDDCVERRLQDETQKYVENSEKLIEAKRKDYDACLADYTKDNDSLLELKSTIEKEMLDQEELSLKASERYKEAVQLRRKEHTENIAKLVDVIEAEHKSRQIAFERCVEEEYQIRHLDLHKKSSEHALGLIATRLGELQKYSEMMNAGLDSLKILADITKTGIPGLRNKIKERIEELSEAIEHFEQQYLAHHQQAYLIVSSNIVKCAQRILFQERDLETTKTKIRQAELTDAFSRIRELTFEKTRILQTIDKEVEKREKVVEWFKRIDTPAAVKLYKKHKKPYPTYLGKQQAVLIQGNLDVIELELIAQEAEWKQQAVDNALKLKQIGYKTDVANQIHEYLAKSSKPLFPSITNVSADAVEKRREEIRKTKDDMMDTESKHDRDRDDRPNQQQELEDGDTFSAPGGQDGVDDSSGDPAVERSPSQFSEEVLIDS